MIRDCRYERDTGFGNFNKRDSGNIAFKNPRSGKSGDKICKENQAVFFVEAAVRAEHEKLGTNVWCSCDQRFCVNVSHIDRNFWTPRRYI